MLRVPLCVLVWAMGAANYIDVLLQVYASPILDVVSPATFLVKLHTRSVQSLIVGHRASIRSRTKAASSIALSTM